MTVVKSLSALLFFCLLSFFVQANEADSLRTDEQVIAFVKKHAHPPAADVFLWDEDSPVTMLLDQAQPKLPSWVKADFNGDGQTDIQVRAAIYGYNGFIVFMANGIFSAR
jgi:hypothetical protein